MNNWKTYLLVAKNTWDETFTYRLNFIVWRIRVVLGFFTSYILWTVVLPVGSHIGDYTQSTIITYIIAVALVGNIVFSSRTGEIGSEINDGRLSNYLLRPLSYLLYWFSKDMGDKAINIFFSCIELTFIFLIIHPPFLLQTSPIVLMLTGISIILAILIYFYCNFLLGLIGFWSNEVWAPRFIFTIVFQFFAGSLFPLDILPKVVYLFFSLTPFPYLLYFPIKIYLGQLSSSEILSGLIVGIFWTISLYVLSIYTFKKGLKLYGAEGS